MFNWKIIAAFSGGTAFGGLISYLILKKKAEKELLEAIEAEKAALQKAYEDRGAAILKAQKLKDEDTERSVAKETREEVIEEQKKVNKMAEDLGYKPKIDYTKYSNKVKKEFAEAESPSEEDRKDIPYLIFEDNYTDELDYEKEELIYFAGNGVLCDIDETRFNLDETIGVDAVNLFDMIPEETIYIRNERLQTDFMVERRQAEYFEGIMHMPHT